MDYKRLMTFDEFLFIIFFFIPQLLFCNSLLGNHPFVDYQMARNLQEICNIIIYLKIIEIIYLDKYDQLLNMERLPLYHDIAKF